MEEKKLENKEEEFKKDEIIYALNLKYSNGTRMRKTPEEFSEFSLAWIPNNDPVKIIDIKDNFLFVSNLRGNTGWIRRRNLTKEKPKIINEEKIEVDAITYDSKCVGGKILNNKGVRYYNIGLEQDPIKGTKTAKGDVN
jgi:hypothetical protein